MQKVLISNGRDMSKIDFIITEEFNKSRLDVFLENVHAKHSRSFYKKLIEADKVLVNNKSVKAGYSLKETDIVTIYEEEPVAMHLGPEDIPINIIYEDSDILIINKDRNMVVHPSESTPNGTLVNALLNHTKELSLVNGSDRPGIVHRLDKDTTGVMVVAKNDISHTYLANQIKDRSFKRYYKAIVEGTFSDTEGVIITQIGRDKKNRLKMAVLNDGLGRYAETRYKTLEGFSGYSLVEFELITGRTHQIRVHAKHMGHEIVGDQLYNGHKNKFSLTGQLLHAYKISFKHPKSNEIVSFEVPLPNDFQEVVNKLRDNSVTKNN